jgi:hypothetical protein
MTAVVSESEEPESATWQAGFLEMLPMIEQRARVAFRDLDAEAQQDAVGEVVANAMCAYRRLHERGELQRAFASALARYAIIQYWDGRRVGTQQCSRDVFSPKAEKKAGYEVLSLDLRMECLIDNRRTPIPDQIAFHLDFPLWLASQTPRNRRIAERLLFGGSTGEVAREFNISSPRVSQLRREFAESWYAFVRG